MEGSDGANSTMSIGGGSSVGAGAATMPVLCLKLKLPVPTEQKIDASAHGSAKEVKEKVDEVEKKNEKKEAAVVEGTSAATAPAQSPPKPHRRVRTLAESRKKRTVKKKIMYDQVQDLPEEFQRCLGIVDNLLRTDEMYPFYEPVDPVALGIPTYFDVVKNPMDLSTVKSNIVSGLYSSSNAFADDMRLMFRNAMLFNPPATFVYDVAEKHLKQFETTFEKQVASYVRSQLRRSSVAMAQKAHGKSSASEAPQAVQDDDDFEEDDEEEDEEDEEVTLRPAAKKQHVIPALSEGRTAAGLAKGQNSHSHSHGHSHEKQPSKTVNRQSSGSAGHGTSNEKVEKRKLTQIIGQIPAVLVDELLNEVWKNTKKRYQSIVQLSSAAHSMTVAEIQLIQELATAVLERRPMAPRAQIPDFSKGAGLDPSEERTLVNPLPNSVSPIPAAEAFARLNGISTVPHSVSPFMQRQSSPGSSGINSDSSDSNMPKILAEKQTSHPANQDSSNVMRPTWSLSTLTPRLPEQTDSSKPDSSANQDSAQPSSAGQSSDSQQLPPSSPQFAGSVSPSPASSGRDAEAWSQFRTQTQLREQRAQIRAKNLEEKRAMLEAEERQRVEHMHQLHLEAIKQQQEEAQRLEAQREEERQRQEREREAIHRRMAGDSEQQADEEEVPDSDMYAEFQNISRMNGSLLQLDGSLLMDFHTTVSDRPDDDSGL